MEIKAVFRVLFISVIAAGVMSALVAGSGITTSQMLQTHSSSSPEFPISEARLEAQAQETFLRMPLYFEENRGQVDPDIRFISRGSGYTLFLTSEEAVLNLQSGEAENQVHSLRMRLIDANPAPEIRAEDRIPGGSSYFIGSDPSKWYTDAAHYERVRWREVYPGIDLVYYGSQTQLQYDFIIAPGANPDHIRMHFSGLDDITITPEGDLLLQVEGGILRQQAPFTYQEIDGQRVEVSSRFIVNDTETVTFEVGAYNPIYPLVIDPALLYSTYLGGTGSDFPYQIAAGSNGNVYITGLTQSVDFRPLNAYDSTHNGSRDVFEKVQPNAPSKAGHWPNFRVHDLHRRAERLS